MSVENFEGGGNQWAVANSSFDAGQFGVEVSVAENYFGDQFSNMYSSSPSYEVNLTDNISYSDLYQNLSGGPSFAEINGAVDGYVNGMADPSIVASNSGYIETIFGVFSGAATGWGSGGLEGAITGAAGAFFEPASTFLDPANGQIMYEGVEDLHRQQESGSTNINATEQLNRLEMEEHQMFGPGAYIPQWSELAG